MIRRAIGSFRAGSGGVDAPVYTMFDNQTLSTSSWCLWTEGATQIDQITDISPTPRQQWKILAFSITAMLQIYGNSSAWGKLGKIIAGIPTPAEQTPFIPLLGYFSTSLLPLPSDMSQVVDLWNPANDSLPPSAVTPQIPGEAGLPISATLILPQPILVTSSDSILIGIWMLPSLLSASSAGVPNRWLQILSNIRYCVTYDDGT